jgi:penicillin-binding protein 1C
VTGQKACVVDAVDYAGRWQASRPLLVWSAACGATALITLTLWLLLGPIPPIIPDTTATIVDRNGIVLYEPLSETGTRNEWIVDVPAAVALATMAAEDGRFRSHPGIDPIAVARAALHDMRSLRMIEGGSTITQQVAKILLGNPPRTLPAKVHEAIVALRLEHRYTKRQILALYVNLAPYGEQTIGIARASRRHFGVAPEELTIAQAAWLASLPRRPSAPGRASARQGLVLARMLRLGLIDDAAYLGARSERLSLDHGLEPMVAPHFVQQVLRSPEWRDGRFGGGGSVVGARSGHRIVTTLDAMLQKSVRGIIAAERADLLRHGAHSVAVAVLDNRTGEWLAWEGSGDYFGGTAHQALATPGEQGRLRELFGGAIDGVTTLRQPGSTLKPFTYALALEEGLTPASVLADVPSHFPTAVEGVVYTPRNYDGRYRGPLRVRNALAGSENVPAVSLLQKLGPPSLLRLLRDAGFGDLTRTADYYGLGLTLGDAEVTLEQLVSGYAMFARGGIAVNPTMVLRARMPPAAARRLVSSRTAFWITDILSDPDAREFVFGRGGNLDFPFPVAVKTGTSQAYNDNWTVGYTRAVTVGVWVGNFDRTALRNSSGVTGAGPIFHAVMLAAMRRAGDRGDGDIVDRPTDLERQPVCALSGLRPSTYCPATESEWLPRDAPVELCGWHHAGRVAWPPEYREWAEAGERPSAASRTTEGVEKRFRITSPPNDATYLVDPTLHREYQSIHFRATSEATWRIDGRTVAPEWSLQRGKHRIIAMSGAGERDGVVITVR